MRFLWIGIAVVLALAGFIVYGRHTKARADSAELKHQLDLAWAEGLPTNAEQFTSIIPPAPKSENAAPLLRKLKGLLPTKADPLGMNATLLIHPSDQNLATASAFLDKQKDYLQVVDQVAKLHRCWFDRDWSQGASVLMPEYASTKTAVQALRLRGSVAALKNDPAAAIRDADEIFSIASAETEEPVMIAGLVGEAAYMIGLHSLADWAFLRPNVPAYRKELQKRIEAFPRPDYRKGYRGDLYLLLWCLDRDQTPAGRKELGVTDSLSGQEQLARLFTSPTQTKIDVIREERDFWAGFNLLPKQQAQQQRDAMDRMDYSLVGDPVVSDLAVTENMPEDLERIRLARKQLFVAASRAFQSPSIPRYLNTKDLTSPFDGQPMHYSYDGKRMKFEVSGKGNSDTPYTLSIPPQPPKK